MGRGKISLSWEAPCYRAARCAPSLPHGQSPLASACLYKYLVLQLFFRISWGSS